MPVEPITQKHRHKDNPMLGSLSALVARPVGKREVMDTPAAKAALDKELTRLGRKPEWD